jgi:hypothetical protein
MHSETSTYRNSPFGILLTWLYEIGSKQCVYLRNVIVCINDEYPEDTHRADAIHRAWVHIAFPGPLIEKMVGNSPIYEDIGKRLQKANIKIRMEKSHRRYCKAFPHYHYVRGLIGLEFSHNLYSKGCGGFQHYTLRYLSSQEPLVNDTGAIATRSEDWESDAESEYAVENTSNPDAAANGYDLTQEIIPSKNFFPTSDIFTILSVLEDAHTWHCCCCLKEPVTQSPPRRPIRRYASYERPYDGYEKPFNEDEHVQSWDEANYTGDDPLRPENEEPRDYRKMTREYMLKKQHKKLAVQREKDRFMDTSMLLASDEHDRVEWRDLSPFMGPIERQWRQRREEAGNPVEDVDDANTDSTD